MKILFTLGTVLFISLNSLSIQPESSSDELPTACFDECDSRASGYAEAYGWSSEQEFSFFSDCYDTYCGNENGQFQFPSGNIH